RTLAFARALRRPRAVQEAALQRILARNAGSDYGRRHGFAGVRSLREYQERVPTVRHEDLADEIAQTAAGRPGVLTTEPVLAFEKTTGSSAASKLIPYTASLLAELQAAVLPWMADVYRRHPALLLGGAYWSVSPLAAERERTAGGLPIGFEEEVQYFGALGAALGRVMLTPPGLARVGDVEACRYLTLRHLLASEDLRLVSVWHPSFLTLLEEAMEAQAERLIEDLRGPHPQRAAVLRRRLDRDGRLTAAAAWPELRLISCWADAAAAPYAAELARRHPRAVVQPKGLLATEGVVSVPWGEGPGAALAVASHVLEFVPEEGEGRPLLADELDEGGTYTVVITTGGGLYRYALGDRVRVVGRAAATPRVEFVGRAVQVSDLCGEKLHESRVRHVVEAALGEAAMAPAFTLVAPEAGPPPAYALFLECPAASEAALLALVRRVEERLLEGHHYAYCRRLGQLGPLRGFRVSRGGARAYLDRQVAAGQRAGSVKPALLSRETGWSQRLEGAFVDPA
ncbi:MAG TPA: GH3 auxin-responsive promoter family protein, partial [Vicinamibacteria bacterium]